LATLQQRNQISQELTQLDQDACQFALIVMAATPATREHEVALAELEALQSARHALAAEMQARDMAVGTLLESGAGGAGDEADDAAK
jgi:uncharacterized protein YkwD